MAQVHTLPQVSKIGGIAFQSGTTKRLMTKIYTRLSSMSGAQLVNLAKRAHVSPATVYRYRADNVYRPQLRIVVSLLEALGYEITIK